MLDVLGSIGFGLFGLAVLISIAVLFSENRKAISWKLVATGVVLQVVFAALVLKVPFGRDVFHAIASGFVSLLDFCRAGSEFIFGSFMDKGWYGTTLAGAAFVLLLSVAAAVGVGRRTVAR